MLVLRTAHVTVLLLASAPIHAQGRHLKCGTYVYRTGPTIVVHNVDCALPLPPPSPWPIIKAIAATPDD